MRIAFLGLGVMGAPMAGHLLRAGHEVATVTHRSPPPQELQDLGLKTARSYSAAAAASDVVILMLPDTPQVEDVLFAENGVAYGLMETDGLVVDMSSISPTAAARHGARIEALGAAYLDAPVSGGDVGAREGSLSIMVGGSVEAFAAAEPLLQLMGRRITHVGPVGAGQTAKIANQIVVALTIEAVAEAMVFSAKAGVDPARVRDALDGGLATSRILDLHAPRMIERRFEPGFRIALHQKDLANALSSARELAVSLPATALAFELMNSNRAHAEADLDHSALFLALERLSGLGAKGA